jgi:hypothetical protein
MSKGRIADVELLTAGSDEVLIAEANEHFVRRANEGFEVWTRMRRVYCYPEEPKKPISNWI